MTINRHHLGRRQSRAQATADRPRRPSKWLLFAAISGLAVAFSIAAVQSLGQAAAEPPRPAQPEPETPLEVTPAPRPGTARPAAALPGTPAGQDGALDGALEQDGATIEDEASREDAAALAERMIEFLSLGPPLEAKLRQRVWAAGREVVEVGHYQQAGRGSGRLRMELQVPIADGKSRWQQTCDGRLAWTREEMAGEIRVRRVDLGKLEESTAAARSQRVPPRLRVGGLVEIIDRIQADFDLRLSEGHIDGNPMLVLKGTLRDEVAKELLQNLQRKDWPELVPRQVRIAVAADSLAAPLPSRIEFWSKPEGRLISLLEIYDVAEIETPGIDQFRFEPGGHDFTNETEMYIARFGLGLAETPLGNVKR